jgi:hypothetical protein
MSNTGVSTPATVASEGSRTAAPWPEGIPDDRPPHRTLCCRVLRSSLVGRFLPKAVAVCFPVAVLTAVIIVAATGGLGAVRDWLMAGVVVCITAIIALAGRGSRRRRSSPATDT